MSGNIIICLGLDKLLRYCIPLYMWDNMRVILDQETGDLNYTSLWVSIHAGKS